MTRLPAMSNQPSATPAPSSGSASTSGAAASPPPSGSRSPTPPERDWTVEASSRVESVVGTLRDKTTAPVTKVARTVVFGLVAAVVGLVAVVLTIIAVVRVVDVYLPFDPYGRRVWIVYAALGAIFLLAGAFCWSKRTRKPQETPG